MNKIHFMSDNKNKPKEGEERHTPLKRKPKQTDVDAVNYDVDFFKYICLAKGEALLPEYFPALGNESAAMFYPFLPRPEISKKQEFIYIPVNHNPSNEIDLKTLVAISDWNIRWESGHLRKFVINSDLTKKLKSKIKNSESNIYFLLDTGKIKHEAYSPIYHLLPQKTLEHFGLPCLKKGLWPQMLPDNSTLTILPKDYNSRLSKAFASYIWPFLCSGSKPSAFSDSEPIKHLAHNLDFWLPYVVRVIETRLSEFDSAPIENECQQEMYLEAQETNILEPVDSEDPPEPEEGITLLPEKSEIIRPQMGGTIWMGKDEAWQATKEIVEEADSSGNLRGIIDAIRSNRVEEDFSPHWSYAKEDFERNTYKKRNKVKIKFVELNGTIPVHGFESEVHENLLWDVFITTVNPKQREIVVALRSGETKIGDISKNLGYANHSPVSKKLKQIQKEVIKFLD